MGGHGALNQPVVRDGPVVVRSAVLVAHAAGGIVLPTPDEALDPGRKRNQVISRARLHACVSSLVTLQHLATHTLPRRRVLDIDFALGHFDHAISFAALCVGVLFFGKFLLNFIFQLSQEKPQDFLDPSSLMFLVQSIVQPVFMFLLFIVPPSLLNKVRHTHDHASEQ